MATATQLSGNRVKLGGAGKGVWDAMTGEIQATKILRSNVIFAVLITVESHFGLCLTRAEKNVADCNMSQPASNFQENFQ